MIDEHPGEMLRLIIPTGPGGRYRLAQVDDYTRRRRQNFPWQPPLILRLRARASSQNIPGTWGFGLWNDPFSLSIGIGGGIRRFPALPNAVWFFFASPPNYLSLRDDLPVQGALASTFCSPNLPTFLLAPGAIALPFLLWKPTARLMRALAAKMIQQDAVTLTVDSTEWHVYSLTWDSAHTYFFVDDQPVFQATITPQGPLGLVIWVDNQYAALPPEGSLKFGTLENEVEAWIEINELEIVT